MLPPNPVPTAAAIALLFELQRKRIRALLATAGGLPFLAFLLIGCAAPLDVPAPAPTAAPSCALTVLPFDGSAGPDTHGPCAFEVHGSIVAHARVRNIGGNDSRDVTQLLVYVRDAAGVLIGTSTAFYVSAGEQLDAWQDLEAAIDMSTHPTAASATVDISPLHVQNGQQLVDVDSFGLEAAP